MTDAFLELRERVSEAFTRNQQLVIQGNNTRHFYGRDTRGEIIRTTDCTGIVDYEPTELVLTARAGTTVTEVERTLAEQGQCLAFDPPRFGPGSTLGGMVASGLSGPARPYSGSCRDYILGMKCLNGEGRILTFGGQVMKNVAGYDVSRLMTGALGTLGILLEISIKVMPGPERTITVSRTAGFDEAIREMNQLATRPLPITASSSDGNRLFVRLAGKQAAVDNAIRQLEDYELIEVDDYWTNLRDHRHEFFLDQETSLWRLSLPSMTPALELGGDWYIEWGGALRWLKTAETAEKIRAITAGHGGHATLFRRHSDVDEIFHPLSPPVLALHQRLKNAFDPGHILNIGRMYREL